MAKFKRYVRKVYPIAGIRWADNTEVSSTDGLLFNVMRIDSDNNRRQIADEQYLIQWDNLVSRISDDLGTPVTSASNLGSAFNVFKEKVGTDLQFRSLSAGTNILITDTGTEIVISNIGAGGDVFKVGTPVANQVGVWTGDGTIEGSDLTWTGSAFIVGSPTGVRSQVNVGTMSIYNDTPAQAVLLGTNGASGGGKALIRDAAGATILQVIGDDADNTIRDFGTTSWRVPQGTDGERPTGNAGQIRFNTTSSLFEGHDGTSWKQFQFV